MTPAWLRVYAKLRRVQCLPTCEWASIAFADDPHFTIKDESCRETCDLRH
jgi:hypothetical protein